MRLLPFDFLIGLLVNSSTTLVGDRRQLIANLSVALIALLFYTLFLHHSQLEAALLNTVYELIVSNK